MKKIFGPKPETTASWKIQCSVLKKDNSLLITFFRHNAPISEGKNKSLDSSDAEFRLYPITTVHEENKPKSSIKKPFSCEKCHECFSQKPYLKVHMQTVHEGKPKKGIWAKKPKCKMCDIFFKSREELNEHIHTVHKGEKPFSCTLCGKSYTEEANLVKHIKKVHEGIKSIQCSLCSYQCATTTKLNTHFSRVHEEKEPTEVKCTLCPFKCKNKAKLNLHFSRVHDEEKEFKCRDCSSGFSKQNQLTMHIMKYHESQTQHTFFQSWWKEPTQGALFRMYYILPNWKWKANSTVHEKEKDYSTNFYIRFKCHEN